MDERDSNCSTSNPDPFFKSFLIRLVDYVKSSSEFLRYLLRAKNELSLRGIKMLENDRLGGIQTCETKAKWSLGGAGKRSQFGHNRV